MKAPLGHTVLGDMLPRISEAARISRRYANHCLRATSVGILKDSGFDDRAVFRLTGHKNPQSLESYCRSSENEKQALARALDGKMCRWRDVEDSSSSSKAAEMTTSCSRQDSFVILSSRKTASLSRTASFTTLRSTSRAKETLPKKSGLLSVSNGLLSVSNGLLSVSNGHLTRNKSLLLVLIKILCDQMGVENPDLIIIMMQ